MRRRVGVVLTCVAWLIAGAVTVRAAWAQGDTEELATRGPRFLLASATPSEAPVRLDVSRTPLLRQRISLDLEGATLGDALARIKQASGLQLIYSSTVVPLERPVHLKAEDITVAGALTVLLLDTDVDVLFSRGGKAVLVRRKEQVRAMEDTGAIVGRVTAKAGGTALAGATVVVEGTKYSATTGSDGRYRITAVLAGTYTVRARYIGYAPGSASVTVSASQEATADFGLEKSAQRLDEVVTTGTVIPTEVRALPSPITVITADEIQEKGITRVDQLFRGEVPGVVSWDEGSGDDQSRIRVRGGSDLFGGGIIKTYVDGVETFSGFLSTIDPNSIERIELIRGPQASTLYGSEALDGVLQVFTKHGSVSSKPVLEGQVAAGAIQTKWVSDNAAPTYRGNIGISGGSDAFSYRVGGGRLYKGEWVAEYRDAEDNLNGSLRAKQGWFTADLSGRLQYQHRGSPPNPLARSYADVAPAFGVPSATDLNYENTGVALTLRAQATPHWQHTLTFGIDRLLQEFIQRAPHLTTPDDTLLFAFSSESQQFTFQYSSALEGPLARSLSGSVTAGVNARSFKGTDLEALAPRTNGSLGTDAILLDRVATRNWGYFAQGQLAVAEALFVTAGVRAEDNPDYGQNYGLAWAPRVGVSYVRPLGGVTVKARASYGKSLRAPFGSARVGSADAFTIFLPNPNIGPESQRGVDAGLELYLGAWGTLQATWYNQTAGDLIDQVLITPGTVPIYQYQNLGEIKNRGLELQGSLSPQPWLTLSGNFAITSSKVQRLSPDYTGDLRVDDQLLSVPKRSGGADLRVAWGGWTANGGLTAVGAWTQIDLVKDFDCFFRGTGCGVSGRDRWTNYPGFVKFRAAVRRRLRPQLTVFMNAENLTNNYAVEESNYSVPTGRTTTLGLEFRF